ncbi:hypothetical protein N0V93_003213 [Gnomoniopsis smithogilvyi]|uniref:Carboxylic ester hydrolase n=1 Tax=Gnomoniopsis smithogilvyi TaxID=1191159 RepID=A0A9W8YY18_9PEZI|nr:hypothetical protein N0V93_003213 [Gnomoniopsis smithogilvyi]
MTIGAVSGLTMALIMGFANMSSCTNEATRYVLQYISKMLPFTSDKATQACDTTTFASLSLSNIHIDSLNVAAYINLPVPSSSVPPTSYNPLSTVDICSLTINYTHPGNGDSITAWVGLPLKHESWNSRFLMNGGGGWVAGLENGTISAVASGFSSASTNAGHSGGSADFPDWGLLSNGSVNWPALEDFGSQALIEAVYLGKQAAGLYYGENPDFSYWNGCSTGGRQGHVMAQLIPEEFDGILAGAPAINWAKFLVSEAWGYVKAVQYGTFPPRCVFDAFSNATLDACDGLDGVKDGVVAFPGLCDFDPSSLIGKTIECPGLEANVTIIENMANIVRDIWTGPTTADGQSIWYGLEKGAELAGAYGSDLLTSTCSSAGNCSLALFPISQGWIHTFLQQQDSSELFSLDLGEFYRVFNKSVADFTSIMSFDDPDLSKLNSSGTKMIVWHGMTDQLIPTNGSVDYYERVVERMGNIDDFYRLFLAPGVPHCGMNGGLGLDPTSEAFLELVNWVEHGKVPETIAATGPAVGYDNTTNTRTIGLCPYPKMLSFTGSDPNDAADFECL